MLVAEQYRNGARLDTIYRLLIVKNGFLVAEKHFNDGSIGLKSNLQSAGKSCNSALVVPAYDQGCLTSLDRLTRQAQVVVITGTSFRAHGPQEEVAIEPTPP